MLKTGVPDAIKLKMELDGVDSGVDLKKLMKSKSSISVNSSSCAPPPPPPPPPPNVK